MLVAASVFLVQLSVVYAGFALLPYFIFKSRNITFALSLSLSSAEGKVPVIGLIWVYMAVCAHVHVYMLVCVRLHVCVLICSPTESCPCVYVYVDKTGQ